MFKGHIEGQNSAEVTTRLSAEPEPDPEQSDLKHRLPAGHQESITR